MLAMKSDIISKNSMIGISEGEKERVIPCLNHVRDYGATVVIMRFPVVMLADRSGVISNNGTINKHPPSIF